VSVQRTRDDYALKNKKFVTAPVGRWSQRLRLSYHDRLLERLTDKGEVIAYLKVVLGEYEKDHDVALLFSR